jgi:coenzyme F420-dependent glucose-6-phosphate dehydrogenase
MSLELGYALSTEEHAPNDLVKHARLAEQAGFTFALVSDHYHPWIDRQGHSPFVWSVLGALAHATERMRFATGVTCPTMRIHPAIVAQAAATTAAMMPGRFSLGVGTGENLNEHILGDVWPEYEIRAEMLEEAVELMRTLWEGGQTSHFGPHYTVSNARLYTVPPSPPQVLVAAGGPNSAELAGRMGDGLVATSPDAELVGTFRASGGEGKPCYGQMTVCWAEDEATAKATAHEWWPNAAIRGEASQELPMPAHFEQLSQMVSEDDVAEVIVCGPDVDRHVAKVREYVDAGFDHVYVHQVGPDQEGFIRFYERDVLPRVRRELGASNQAA